jgi:uncharacterized protein (TIGR00661 family)
MIIKSCDRVLALSFSNEPGNETIKVVPPLVRREFRTLSHKPGDRYLVYMLHEGFIYDMIMLARRLPGFKADLFTSLNPSIEIPDGIRIHPFDAEKFSHLMASCKGLITTAGFDSAAEAACHGIPLAVIPSYNHFEQRCNGREISARGIGIVVSQIDENILERMRPFDCVKFREWVDQAGKLIIEHIKA